jgi:hypothetical protein
MQENARALLAPVLQRLDQALGESYSLVAYGSSARGEFLPGVSDLNLLLVAERFDLPLLRKTGAALREFEQSGHPPPLLMVREEWQRAGDVFPIEITDMQAAHETLRGADPLPGIAVDRSDLRRALEQELRGKLLRLRQAYALHADDPQVLETVVAMSVSSVAALLRVLGLLVGLPVPRETPAMLRLVGPALSVDLGVVALLWEERRRGAAECPPERFEQYLAAIAAAIRFVDQFTGGTR